MTTLATAEALREAGMAAAEAHAEREHMGWGDLAYAFLVRYCRAHQTFVSENVSEAGRQWGLIQPPTDRAFGPVYRRAIRNGIIRQVGYGVSLRRHKSICPLWESQIYGSKA